MKEYVWNNNQFAKEYIDKNLPGVTMTDHEGTYLIWLDFNGTGLTPAEVEDLIVKKAKLWLDSGRIFGKTGYGYQRINTACTRQVLTEALDRIRDALNKNY